MLIPRWSQRGKRIEVVESVTRRLFGITTAAILALSAVVLQAQGAAEPQVPTSTTVFRSTVDAIVVAATVRDARGRIVRNLKQADFSIVDAGFPRKIDQFFSGDAPISLAVLLDISGSMAVGGNMERARQAVDLVLSSLQPPRDEAALYTFDSKLVQVVPFTTQLERIKRISLEGKPFGTTTLYDSIGEAARSAAERSNRHRALLVITDGVDTGSRLTAPQVSGIAASIDVPVYLLTVVNPVDHPGEEFAVLRGADKVAETATLADLARWQCACRRRSSVQDRRALRSRQPGPRTESPQIRFLRDPRESPP